MEPITVIKEWRAGKGLRWVVRRGLDVWYKIVEEADNAPNPMRLK